MDINAIERVRAVSRAAKNGPWVQWFDEMCRKTVFRRLSKWLPMDAEVDDLLRRDEEMSVAPPARPTIEGTAEDTGKLAVLEGGLVSDAAEVVDTPDDAA
jgi:recombinational DNA repair protein RecT